MRFAFACFAALLLTGCANSSLGGLGGSTTVARPKTIVVTDFVFADGVTAIDRAYTTRLERKIGGFPTFERKPRTLERVNEEIVASIVATLRGAGLDAQPGGADGVALSDGAVLVGGTLRGTEPAPSDKKPKPISEQIGFGTGRSNVVADVKILSGGKRQLTAFTAEASAGRGPAVNAKLATGQDAAIAAALADQRAAPEKLSSEVEAQARRLGRAIGDKVLGFAREQGWLDASVAAVEPAATEPEKPVKPPAAKPEKKTAKKPAAPEAPDADRPEN